MVFFSVFSIVRFFGGILIPYFVDWYNKVQSKQTTKLTEQLEESFIFWQKRQLMLITLSPFIFGAAAFVLSRNFIIVVLAFVFGLCFPGIMVKSAYRMRIKKFQSQLVDALIMLSSSLKAGLSFIQAIEVLCEEMPPPISQEFKLVLKENKWGISMEESLIKLRKRIPLEEVNLLVTSILIARESGGEIPKVLLRLTMTIRDNLKLKEKIGTLTLQGKLQGFIMMFLPIGFTYFVFKQNPEHFVVMWQNSMGRLLIMIAVALQIAGMALIKKISTIKI